jgi:hypothetical protein
MLLWFPVRMERLMADGSPTAIRSEEDLFDDAAGDVGEAVVAAGVAVG